MKAKGRFGISCHGESVNVEFDRFIDLTRVWSDDPDILRDGQYSVNSDVAVDSFKVFCDYINTQEVAITQKNYLDLQQLAEEFKCKKLQDEIQANVTQLMSKESESNESFDLALEVMKMQKWMVRQEKENAVLRQMFASLDKRLLCIEENVSRLSLSQNVFEERLNTIAGEMTAKLESYASKQESHGELNTELASRIDTLIEEMTATAERTSEFERATKKRIDDLVHDITEKDESCRLSSDKQPDELENRVNELIKSVETLSTKASTFDTRLDTLDTAINEKKAVSQPMIPQTKNIADESIVTDLIAGMKAVEMRIATAEQYIIAGANRDNTHDNLIDSVKGDVGMLKQMMSVSDNLLKSLTKSFDDRSYRMESAIRTNSELIEKLVKNKKEVQSWIQQTTIYFEKEVTPLVSAMKRNHMMKEMRKSCGPLSPHARPTSFDPDAVVGADECGPAPPFWGNDSGNPPPGLETVL